MLNPRLRSVVVMLATVACVSPSAGQESPWGDAVLIACNSVDTLLPPPDLVESIEQDLKVIRAQVPTVRNIHASTLWVLGRILVQLTPSAFDEFLAGDYHGFDALNAVYGTPRIVGLYPGVPWLIMDFNLPYDPFQLSKIYASCEGVLNASGDEIGGIPGGVSQNIRLVKRSSYHFEHYSGWTSFETLVHVNGGNVEILETGGWPLPVNASTWGQIKARALGQ